MCKRDLHIWKSPLTLFRRSGRRWDGISTGRRIQSKWADGWSQNGHSNWWSGFHGRVRAICSTPWIYSRIIKWIWNEIVRVYTCFGSVCVWANLHFWNGEFSEFHVVEIWESLLQSRYHFAIQLGASTEGLCVLSPRLRVPLLFCAKMKVIYDPTKRNETNNEFEPPDFVRREKWNTLYCVNIDS